MHDSCVFFSFNFCLQIYVAVGTESLCLCGNSFQYQVEHVLNAKTTFDCEHTATMYILYKYTLPSTHVFKKKKQQHAAVERINKNNGRNIFFYSASLFHHKNVLENHCACYEHTVPFLYSFIARMLYKT